MGQKIRLSVNEDMMGHFVFYFDKLDIIPTFVCLNGLTIASDL